MYKKSENLIYEFETHPTKEGYIGYTCLNYKMIWDIFKNMLKNSLYNIFSDDNKKRMVKIWAIDDNEYNYNIYIENFFE